MLILDTNVLSELVRKTPSPMVIAWAKAQPQSSVYTTAISEAELLYGIELMPAGRNREALSQGIAAMLGTILDGHVLPFDRAATRDYALWAATRRRAGRASSIADLQIAAIARARRVSAIATRNTRDFAGCGVPVIDPWQ